MSKIRILSEHLANQIAAGEVVERPASIVKELVENSLDAKANRIEIEIEGSGTRLIRVIDNGEGMSEDDLLMSLERHGTSKIQTGRDLGAIATLGFRGEAIPSIGSVAKLSITSRLAQDDLGTRVVVHYGKLIKVHEVGSSFGTTVEVCNLFGKTPARRKFLKTARTELGHIDEVVKNYGLGCPEISFILRVDRKDSIYLDNTMTIQQRLGNIMRYDGPFIPIGADQNSKSNQRILGFLVPPEKITVGSAKLRVFVNGRAIRDRMIVHGVAEGLRGFLLKGKNPSGLIHLVLPPEAVDVNVHPAKQEVRFHDFRDIHSLIVQAVSQAMLSYQQTIKTTIFGKDRTTEASPIPLGQDSMVASLPEMTTPKMSSPLQYGATESAPVLDTKTGKDDSQPYSDTQPLFTTAEPLQSALSLDEMPANEPDIQDKEQKNEHKLLVIGQLDDLYIFCKNSEGLLVIDQHAAHERLLYNKLYEQYLANNLVQQNLMFPETVELSVFQAQLTEKNEMELRRMGFSIREFGGSTYVISAIPALAGNANPHELFLDILEQFGSEHDHQDGGGSLNTILASIACKAAVKGGTNLSSQEIKELLDDMASADLLSHCPHGRPVIRQFTRDEVKKWFCRT